MRSLVAAGFNLLPLGRGKSGKAPLLRYKDRYLPLKQVLGAMASAGSYVYGVRLDGLAVVDCDDPEIARQMQERFGPAVVRVTTPRGCHLYYRWTGGALPDLRAEGLPVDLKSGANQQVVGPGSVRMDGGTYVAAQGNLAHDTLSVLQLRQVVAINATPLDKDKQSGGVSEGGRHRHLVAVAMQIVRSCSGVDDLLSELLIERDRNVAKPASMANEEVKHIANWAWSKRMENRLWSGRASVFQMSRLAFDALKGSSSIDEALGLYCTLLAFHGHVPGQAFPIKWRGMKESGHTTLGEKALRKARVDLENAGLLRKARGYIVGKSPAMYQLALPRTIAGGEGEDA